MDSFENRHVYPYSPKPRLWLRFIDDILMVWDDGIEELDKFIPYLNTRHPNIKFSEEISKVEVSFLDILISKGPTGKLRTDLFSKATDANNYLHYTSAHTKPCRDGIPFGQFLRIKRICSDNNDFLNRCIEKALHMKRRGYPVELLHSAFASACGINRRDLLVKRKRVTDNTPDNLVGVTTFHPSCRAFADTIKENWPILGRSTTTEGLSASRLIIAYRRPENLGDILIRAKLPPLDRMPKRPKHTHKSTRCTTRCAYCLKLDRSGKIVSKTTGRSYISMKNVTCKSSNLIYCLSSRICSQQYVGQTQQTLMKRVYAHLYAIRTKGDTSVSKHFNSPGHGGSTDMNIHIVEFIHCYPNKAESQGIRDKVELKWIHRLRTVFPQGLNVMDTRFSTV